MYVYKHTSPNGKVYIGITSQNPERRWRNGEGYKNNPHFWRAIQKYGWENFKHEIVASFLSKEDACKLEIELIKKYNSANPEFGYNNDNGGVYAGKHSKESRKKISESRKGKYGGTESPRYGKHHTEESKKKMSEAQKKRFSKKENHPSYGKKSKYSKPVYKINPITNEILDEYENSVEAAKANNIAVSCVRACCQGRIFKTKNGFKWQYVYEPHEYIPHPATKPCCQCSKDGNLIACYDSIIKASKITNIDATTINKCLKGVYNFAGGYIWRYKDD